MCDVPPRRFRAAITPLRAVLGVTSIALIAIGIALRNEAGLVVLGVGAVALFATVVFPTVREVEFGFPVGIRVVAALRNREGELRRAFESQRGELVLCAHLLCGDPVAASELLEAAWSRAAASWRGPVTPALRPYLLCVFLELLARHRRLTGGAAVEPRDSPLASLPTDVRTVVVLKDFAELPLAMIASMTGRPLTDVASDLRAAEATLDRPRLEGGAP